MRRRRHPDDKDLILIQMPILLQSQTLILTTTAALFIQVDLSQERSCQNPITKAHESIFHRTNAR